MVSKMMVTDSGAPAVRIGRGSGRPGEVSSGS